MALIGVRRALIKPKVAGVTPSSLAWVSAATESAATTTSTYSSMSIGAANANRVVAVGIGARGATSTITGVTIDSGGGAVAMTHVSGTLGNSSNNSTSDIWYLAVPTGTTATIVATWSVAQTCTVAEVYRIITSTPTPSTGTTNTQLNGLTVTNTFTVPANGFGFSVEAHPNNVATAYTNATLDNNTLMGATRTTTSGTTTGTGSITVTATITGSNTIMAMSSAAWSP